MRLAIKKTSKPTFEVPGFTTSRQIRPSQLQTRRPQAVPQRRRRNTPRSRITITVLQYERIQYILRRFVVSLSEHINNRNVYVRY